MNWISKLLRRPAAKAATLAAPKAPPPAPADDSEALRRALHGASGDEQRSQAAGRLGRALAALRQAPRGDDPPTVWVAAVCQVADKALALAWAAGVAGEADLGEVAIHGRFGEVRLAALQRVEDEAVLERIAQASRDKDKGVYRQCAERLRQRHRAEDDKRRAAAMAAELARLLDVAPLPLSRVLDLEKEFRTLGEGVPLLAECIALMDQLRDRLQHEAAAQRDLQTRLAATRQLLGECSNAIGTEPAQCEAWRARLHTLAHAQAGLPSWLAGQAASGTVDELLADIDRRVTALGAESERILACEQFLATLGAAGATDAESPEGHGTAWAALPKPGDPAVRRSLEQRWLALQPPPVAAAKPISSPTAPASPPPPPARIDHEAVRPLLEELELAVEQGRLADAEAAAGALDRALGGQSLHGPMDARLQRALVQLGNLRGWARWGKEQARENLIATAEQLSGAASGVDELAHGVQDLREQWKQLNVHGPTARRQWERFDAALTQAYQPVAARRAEEAARQAVAAAAKAALCDEWQSYCAGIVWEHADYKVIEVQRLEMLRRWRGAEQAGFRDERTLRKRLDALLKGIDQRLDAVRAAEIERRQQLIAEAEALVEMADLGRAINGARALQERWTQQAMPLRLDRGDEQELWQRFRAACTAIFARRQEQRTRQTAERAERTRTIAGLLEALSASLTGTDANGIRRDLARFRKDWEAARADGREAADPLEERAGELQQQARQRIEALLRDERGAQFELLAKKAALAESVEATAAANAPAQAIVAAAQAAWADLPRLPGKTETLLAERLARAPAVTASELAAGRESREAMLLDLEIALGLPSPESFSETRRRRQLEHLQNRFGADARHVPAAEAGLVRWYATAAASDPALDQRMTAVKVKLLDEGVKSP